LPVLVQFCFLEDRAVTQAHTDKHHLAGDSRRQDDKPGKIHKELGITRMDAHRLAAAVNHIRFGFLAVCDDTAKRAMDEEARALMREWAPEARALFALFHAAKGTSAGRVLYTGPVIGVALVTLRYQPSAYEFWRKAIGDDGLRRGDPAKALLEWFLSKEGRVANTPIKALACSAAWRVYYTGRNPLAKISPHQVKALTIAGTPVHIGDSIQP
jgi:hypothetical protein